MRAAFFIPVFAAAVFAQDSSSSGTEDAYPQTTFLQQTNSLGVVTGQPSVVTSQPSNPAAVSTQPDAATSVGLPASIPAVGSGITTILVGGPSSAPNATQTLVVSANNSTTIVLSGATTTGASGSGTGASGTGSDATGTGATGSGSQTGSGTAESTGAAATMKAVAGSVVGVGAFMAVFL